MGDSKISKSATQSPPSPDGTMIATLSPTGVTVTNTVSSDVVRAIKFPPDLPGDVTTVAWSKSSRGILVGMPDQIHVFSIADDNYHANIQNPSSAVTKPTFICFGADDDEVCAWSAFGIKLTLFSLATSRALEISNPKFYTPSSAPRGVSFRPSTHHLAVLTQSAGKDMVSIHSPKMREVQRAWFPDTVDVQGLLWSPDGKWLALWESAAQGHKVLIYTPDGHLFKDWRGPISPEVNSDLGLGIKLVMFSPDSTHLAVADGSCYICVINMTSMTEEFKLQHPQDIDTREALQNMWKGHF